MSHNFNYLNNQLFDTHSNPSKRQKVQTLKNLMEHLITNIRTYNDILSKNINDIDKDIKTLIYKIEINNTLMNDKIEKILENQVYIMDYLNNIRDYIQPNNNSHYEQHNFENNNINKLTTNLSMFS
jgi:hypothetical protein